MILAIILIFIAVFLVIYSLLGMFFNREIDVKTRMNTYINAVTADLKAKDNKVNISLQAKDSDKNKQLREIFEKYGKQFENRSYIKKIEFELQKADLPLRGYEFLFMVLGMCVGSVFLFFLINRNIISMVVAGILGIIGPIFFVKIKQQRKLQKFNSQIGDALVLISNSLKAGYGFMQAIDMVAKEMTPPIQTEFGRVIQDINLGTTTEDALVLLTERVKSPDLDLVITAMLIQRQIGGNLAEILDNISNTIRERIRIHGEVKTLTAQGRLSGFIIGSLPVALGLLLLLINPKYITELFTDPRGQLMIIYAVVAEVIAILIIKKIIAIKV
ncbi:MAG TPA: type II secretion system F family protein [Bacillota bacterium]|nr:type II secretion system F family protein [Bacillota bacterium]HOL10399.1 type II secretion system F family protein [Bacillota bacterium]HPO97452.1 type II secretion system F family protein [Bacillota bacterium]